MAFLWRLWGMAMDDGQGNPVRFRNGFIPAVIGTKTAEHKCSATG